MNFLMGLALAMSIPFLTGFDMSKHSIPLDEILSGGPPKDGIPAILEPKFVSADKADFIRDKDRILGLVINGEAKAYPIKILNWHEIVNDTIGGQPVFVSYCPLCGTGMAFDAVLKGKKYTFGVSGRLYKSDVLMYDHQTDSLWSQIKREAVTGDLLGTRLSLLPLVHTTWVSWKKEHPKTLVLSTDTGYGRDYRRDPYASYADTERLMFPVGKVDKRYPSKTWVLGIERNGITRAYPFTELAKAPGPFSDSLGTEDITVLFDTASRTARIKSKSGEEIPTVAAFWFAWAAFHPETEIFVYSQAKVK